MTENKKTEKWSSLRLELQQFSPQEFVAGCWKRELTCSKPTRIADSSNNHHSHSTNKNESIVLRIKNELETYSLEEQQAAMSQQNLRTGYGGNGGWGSLPSGWTWDNYGHFTTQDPYSGWVIDGNHS